MNMPVLSSPKLKQYVDSDSVPITSGVRLVWCDASRYEYTGLVSEFSPLLVSMGLSCPSGLCVIHSIFKHEPLSAVLARAKWSMVLPMFPQAILWGQNHV